MEDLLKRNPKLDWNNPDLLEELPKLCKNSTSQKIMEFGEHISVDAVTGALGGGMFFGPIGLGPGFVAGGLFGVAEAFIDLSYKEQNCRSKLLQDVWRKEFGGKK